PTVRDLMTAVDGTLVHGDRELLDRESSELIVGAMTLPNVLDRLTEGAVVIVPADREEVVLGIILAHRSETFPYPAGIVTNGGFEMSPQVARLLDGLGSPMPVIACDGGTMATVARLSAATGRITPTS